MQVCLQLLQQEETLNKHPLVYNIDNIFHTYIYPLGSG